MPITVKLANGTQHSVDVADFGGTVSDLKSQLAAALEIPADEQRIILRGKVLKDEQVLSAVGMEDGSVVHVVRSRKAAAPAAPVVAQSTSPANTSAAPATATTPQSAPSQAPPSEAAANPYAALMTNFGAPQAQFPSGGAPNLPAAGNPYANMGMGMGMGGAGGPTPQQAAEMMQNPMMQQMMQQALNDPQFTQYIIQSSPQLANLPPQQQQAVIEMMRNPYMMQQAMSMFGASGAGAGMPNAAAAANPPSSGASAPPMMGFNPAMFAPPPPQGNPREIYREQLQQLRDMGFPNEEANIAALQQAQGNVQFALERLLGA